MAKISLSTSELYSPENQREMVIMCYVITAGVVLCEELVIVGIHDGGGGIVSGQCLGIFYTVRKVLGSAIFSEMESLMDNHSRLGKDTVVGGIPEGTVDVDFSEITGH